MSNCYNVDCLGTEVANMRFVMWLFCYLPSLVLEVPSMLDSLLAFVSMRMTCNGKTSTKGSVSTAADSTAGNLSQLLLRSCFWKGNRKDKPTIEYDPEIEKTLKKNRSRVKAQRAL
ncbi:hypothetical protein PIB30_072895 [Stylosanthes scabra]|uniref:Uncharacterized protein n=1 Tax=Stylosanthes scabra TaxID=79078 RepID=A0ABU6YR13_9FABA|nr:hypothetical protein [Stylosanthes scabra]